MAEKLGSAVLELRTDDSKFTKGVKRAQTGAKKLDRSLGKTQRAAKKLGTGLASLGGRLAKLGRSMASLRGAAVLAAGVAGLGLMIKRSLDAADKIGKMADAIGISTKALQEYRFAAGLSGVETGKLDQALLKATKNIGELGRKSSELDTALRDLDSALLANIRSAGSVEEAINLAFVAMAGYEDQTKRAAVASAIFGRSGIVMTNIVRDGVDAFRAMIARAKELGLIIPEALIRNAEAANDALSEMFQVIDIASTTTLLTFAPLITEIAGAFIGWLPAIKGASDALGLWLGLLDGVSVEGLKAGLAEAVEELREFEEGAIRSASAMQFVAEAKGFDSLAELILQAKLKIEEFERAIRSATKAKDELLPVIDVEAHVAVPLGGFPVPPDQEEFNAAMKKRIELEQRTARVILETRTAQERYNKEMVELKELLDLGKIDWETYERAVEAAKKELDEFKNAGVEAFTELERIGVDAFEDLTNALLEFTKTGKFEWTDLAKVAVRAIFQIIRAQSQSTGGGIFGEIFSAFTGQKGPVDTGGFELPSFRHGGGLGAGQIGLVGEAGREIAMGGVASTIFSNKDTEAILGGGGPVFNIDARGADRQGMRELRSLIEQLDGSIEPRAVSAIVDMQRRSLSLLD